MPSDPDVREVLLDDSQATLRQVKEVLNDFADDPSASDGESQADLQVVLQQVSTVRHEINNHLMAALAEVQLLLMDVEDDELRESYEIIQQALRGMRAAVAAVGRTTS